MGIHQFYTVFDLSADTAKCDCAPNSIVAHLDLPTCKNYRSIWWRFRPLEYLSSCTKSEDGSVHCLKLHESIAIKYSLEPNLILRIGEGQGGFPYLTAGPNGIKAGDELSWTGFNLHSFPLDAEGYPDLSTHVHEQDEKLREACNSGQATVSDKAEIEESSCSSRRLSVSSSSPSDETEYCLEHDEESGGVYIGYVERGPVDYVESESEDGSDEE